MEALTPIMSFTSRKNLLNFGPLTPEFTMIIWQPFTRQLGEIGETCSLAFHNRWQEPLNGFVPKSHERRVWSCARTSLKVKVKSQRSRSTGIKTRCELTTPQHRPNGTRSLQIASRKHQTQRFYRCIGVTSPAFVRWAWRATAGSATHF